MVNAQMCEVKTQFQITKFNQWLSVTSVGGNQITVFIDASRQVHPIQILCSRGLF